MEMGKVGKMRKAGEMRCHEIGLPPGWFTSACEQKMKAMVLKSEHCLMVNDIIFFSSEDAGSRVILVVQVTHQVHWRVCSGLSDDRTLVSFRVVGLADKE
jgi:hypothetical protein